MYSTAPRARRQVLKVAEAHTHGSLFTLFGAVLGVEVCAYGLTPLALRLEPATRNVAYIFLRLCSGGGFAVPGAAFTF